MRPTHGTVPVDEEQPGHPQGVPHRCADAVPLGERLEAPSPHRRRQEAAQLQALELEALIEDRIGVRDGPHLRPALREEALALLDRAEVEQDQRGEVFVLLRSPAQVRDQLAAERSAEVS